MFYPVPHPFYWVHQRTVYKVYPAILLFNLKWKRPPPNYLSAGADVFILALYPLFAADANDLAIAAGLFKMIQLNVIVRGVQRAQVVTPKLFDIYFTV